jgi:uncharacterized membrane protein
MWIRARLAELVEDVRGSYWFVPALLALLGFSAGLLLVYIDATVGDDWMGRFEWFYGSRPAGARSLLSTVAGSTITVAGVVFSITLAAVTYASGQYGPRLLTYFIRDKGNQVTLGVFIGTFLYCLVVLRTIRSAEEASADSAGALREAFVPHLAMFGALALAITSIAVLIYFVHHVTDGIHINNVIARIGRRLLADIAERCHENAERRLPRAEHDFASGALIRSDRTGYVESIDEQALVKIAEEHDVLLSVLVMAGDFVHRGRPLLRVDASDAKDLAESVELFSISRKRSALQDLRFPINELVELAARALSPGVNDPFTAIACMDWLGAALIDLSAMPQPAAAIADEQGHVRLIMPRLGYADYVDAAIGRLRPYAARDANASAHLLKTLSMVWEAVTNPAHRTLLEIQRDRLRGEIDRRGED